jgi:hypothetical protein
VANARAARSLRLAQRIIAAFVQALDFITVKALITNLHPGAERPERGQLFDSITDGLSRRCETTAFSRRLFMRFARKSSAGSS